MTDKQFCLIYGDALNCDDREAFVSDWALSSEFAPEDEDEDSIDPALIVELGEIWDVAHSSVKDIRSTTGLSQAAFGTRHLIPTRTVENWESGTRSDCPEYIKLLLAQAEGVFRRRK